MKGYTFKIDGKSFPYSDNLFDEDLEQDNKESKNDYFSYLELMCNLAPVYYLYRFKKEKSLYENLGRYALLSMQTISFFYSAKRLFDKSKIDNFLAKYFGDDKLQQFILLTDRRLQDEFSQSEYKESVDALRLEESDNGKIQNLVDDIAELCETYSPRRNAMIYRRILRIIKNIDIEYSDLIYSIKKALGLPLEIVIQAVFLENNSLTNNVQNICRSYIRKRIDFLSITPSISNDYTKQLELMCNAVLNPVYFMKSHFDNKCLAIINDNGKEYFAISGVEDYPKNQIFYPRIKQWADDVNANLFNKNATWCYLSDKTRNYIKKSPDKIDESHFEYIGSSLQDYDLLAYEHKPEDNLKYYTCCERKILGFDPNMRNYELFVLKKPCFRCVKALYSNVSRIFAYFEDLKWRKVLQSGNSFKPKEYKITPIFVAEEV